MTSSMTEQLDDGFVQDPTPPLSGCVPSAPSPGSPCPAAPVWLVTRYADARAALADSRLIKDWRTLWPGRTPTRTRGSLRWIPIDGFRYCGSYEAEDLGPALTQAAGR